MAKMTLLGVWKHDFGVQNQVSGSGAAHKIRSEPEKYHVFSEKQVKSLIRGSLEVYMNLYRDFGLKAGLLEK
jgi:hypothetical protein